MGQVLERVLAPPGFPELPDPDPSSEPVDPDYWMSLEGLIAKANEMQQLQQDKSEDNGDAVQSFPDLVQLPPEIALTVLSNLNATDLCLAECVWQQLASDDILWQGLCKEQWPITNVYSRNQEDRKPFKRVFLLLDEGTLTFNSDADQGMKYFFDNDLLSNDPMEIAKFFHHTTKLSKGQMRLYLQKRPDIVDCMMELQNYQDQFLPNALRKCFSKMEAPNDRGRYLQELLMSFSKRFCQCNPKLGYSVDSVYVMCFSLILLSVDLTSPHVKNKMSKREFIRNTRNALLTEPRTGDDLFGAMYDNVFIRGHVSGEGKVSLPKTQQFIPGYLALFL